MLVLLERAAPLFGPPFYNHLCLSKEFDAVLSLGVQIAKEALAPAAKREEGHRCSDPDIYTDIPGNGLVAELSRRSTTAGEDTCHVAKASIIDQLDRFFN